MYYTSLTPIETFKHSEFISYRTKKTPRQSIKISGN